MWIISHVYVRYYQSEQGDEQEETMHDAQIQTLIYNIII